MTKKPKKKRRKSFKEEGDLDADRHVDLTISRLDSQLLADLLAKQTKRFAPQLSLIEHEERRVPSMPRPFQSSKMRHSLNLLLSGFLQICTAQALVNTTDWSEPRTLDTLPAFLRTYARPDGSSKDLSHAPTGKGIPHTIVVAGSALRAADLTRSVCMTVIPDLGSQSRCLRVFQTETATVAKLFAKHIKISEAKSFVQKTRSVNWVFELAVLLTIAVST